MAKITDLQILELVLENPAATDAELGKQLGMSRVQINRRRNAPSFQSLLEQAIRQSLEILKIAKVKAARRICGAVDSRDDRIALKAAAMIFEVETKTNSTQAFDSERGANGANIVRRLERLKKIWASSSAKLDQD